MNFNGIPNILGDHQGANGARFTGIEIHQPHQNQQDKPFIND
jgi:hypothetical protein